MLRALLLALLGANLLFFVWGQGWLGGTSTGEPQRLASQVRPEWVRVLPPEPAASALVAPDAASAGAAASAPPADAGSAADAAALVCVEAGPLSAVGLQTAEAALRLAGVAASRWVLLEDAAGDRWLRFQAADATLLALLQGLPASEMGGGFKPCRAP